MAPSTGTRLQLKSRECSELPSISPVVRGLYWCGGDEMHRQVLVLLKPTWSRRWIHQHLETSTLIWHQNIHRTFLISSMSLHDTHKQSTQSIKIPSRYVRAPAVAYHAHAFATVVTPTALACVRTYSSAYTFSVAYHYTFETLLEPHLCLTGKLANSKYKSTLKPS